MEYWDLFDEQERPLGKTHLRGTPLPEGAYHRVVCVWLMDRDGRFLMSRRSENKAGAHLWERSGGSVLAGESPEEGARREVKEELGIDLSDKKLHFLRTRLREQYSCFCYDYLCIIDKNVKITLQKEEVEDSRFMTLAEIEEIASRRELLANAYNFRSALDFFEAIKDAPDGT